jgi:secreted PhoX family phosphatase
MHVPYLLRVTTGLLLCSAVVGCDETDRVMEPISGLSSTAGNGQFTFTPLPTSAVCGQDPNQPFVLPPGYAQTVIAREGDGGTIDLWDMNTQNENGPEAGRFLYRTHEVGANGQVSVTDLETGVTRVVAQRADWERLDGIVWTPWQTLLIAEETVTSALKDPALPAARGGHVYEVEPTPGAAVLRSAIGSRSHEGLRFDPEGNLYGISEASPPTGGYIYKFVPARRGDLSQGQLYALKVTTPTGDRTGEAVWLPLNTAAAALDSDAEATRVGATGYGRPEDVEIFTSSGNQHGGWTLFVAVTSENRVLGIDLREAAGGSDHATAFVYDYVRRGLNAPADFSSPDNVALDKAGNLYITEDPSTPPGADIWTAAPAKAGQHQPAESTVRFASLKDCAAEPSGIYFDTRSWRLFVHVQHAGAPDPRDLEVVIERVE